MRPWSKAILILAAFTALLLAWEDPAGHGKELFVRRCSGCHAPDIDKEGPRLRGVVGRQAGSVPGFSYSAPLKKSGIRWDDKTIDQWLTDPDLLVPDTNMAFRVADPEERKAIIAYLKTLVTH